MLYLRSSTALLKAVGERMLLILMFAGKCCCQHGLRFTPNWIHTLALYLHSRTSPQHSIFLSGECSRQHCLSDIAPHILDFLFILIRPSMPYTRMLAPNHSDHKSHKQIGKHRDLPFVPWVETCVQNLLALCAQQSDKKRVASNDKAA